MPLDISSSDLHPQRTFLIPRKLVYWLIAQLWVWFIVAVVVIIPSLTHASENEASAFDAKVELLLSLDLSGTLEGLISTLGTAGSSCVIRSDIHARCDGVVGFDLKQKTGSLKVTSTFDDWLTPSCSSFNGVLDCLRAALGEKVIRERRAGSGLRIFDLDSVTISLSEQILTISVRN